MRRPRRMRRRRRRDGAHRDDPDYFGFAGSEIRTCPAAGTSRGGAGGGRAGGSAQLVGGEEVVELGASRCTRARISPCRLAAKRFASSPTVSGASSAGAAEPWFRWGGVHGWRAHRQRRGRAPRRGMREDETTRRTRGLVFETPCISPQQFAPESSFVVSREPFDDPPRAKLAKLAYPARAHSRADRVSTHPLRIPLEVRLDARVFGSQS